MKLLNILAFIITSVEASGGDQHGRPFRPSPPALRPPPAFPRPHPKNPSIPGPIVDLGYERHQAIVNSTGHYNNFSNIPYAIPPLQDLRFSKPLPIDSTSSHINDGSIGQICPQARPDWTEDAGLLVALYTLGLINNIGPSHLKANPIQDVPHGWESEDCLLLDAVVPEGFYQKPPSDPTDIYNMGKVLPSTEIVAQTLQAYIVGFVKEGNPNRGLIGPEFPVYKDGIVILGSKENGSMIVPEGELQNADSITPTFSDIFKTKNDGKKVEWHAEWKSD
ncbi:hypothetical protein BCON_0090g00280 [Botryotinia convoluta]|uniref:Carboxylesterase type B domain-containing protein n=1 Tax=Botryotinia convoluta TaxID=54673 RepID=A0A4Z1I4H3_9HELO|nr:hypothetical protein BCON_0090g00280 [Botryotinia convoluta]